MMSRRALRASLGASDSVILALPTQAVLTEVVGRELAGGCEHRAKSVTQGNSETDMKHLMEKQ